MATESTYTYRGGDRLELTKDDDAFVVRSLPESALDIGLEPVEQVSSASTVITSSPEQLESQMSEARRSVVAHHSYRTADGTQFLITDRIYVVHPDGLTAETLSDFAAKYGLILVDVISDSERLYQLTDATGLNPIKLVQRLTEGEDRVQLAENDVNYRTSTSFELPSDQRFSSQWHLHQLTTHPQFDPRTSSRCDEAWIALESFGSSDIVIGIADDGCRLDHLDFDSPDKFAGWGYFDGVRLIVEGDIDAERDRMYETGSDHGTSCAGVAAGEADGVLTVGAAPGCRLAPIKWESNGPSLFISDSKLRNAIDYLASRVDIISNSWGSSPMSFYGSQVTSRIGQLASSGGRRGTGIVFLWAAGNENCPINHQTDIEVPYTSGWTVQQGQWVWIGPDTARSFRNNLVDIPGVLHIAALGSTAQRSHYSNYGTGVDLCAPTNNNHLYLGSSLGLGVTTARGATTSSTTGTFGGTSSATPLVAGIAAMVITANPELSAAEVISILQRTASRDLDTTPWPKTPPNQVMGSTTWDVSPVAPFDAGGFTDGGHADGTWSPWFGHGKVDALAAVTEALETATPPSELVAWQQTVTGHLARSGDRRAWFVTFSGRLTAQLAGADGADFDLHARRESPSSPTRRRRSEGITSSETIELHALEPERWRLTVVSWQGAGDFSLLVTSLG